MEVTQLQKYLSLKKKKKKKKVLADEVHLGKGGLVITVYAQR